MCPHCMDDSCPDGGMMYDATFGNAIRFVRENGCPQITISGEEVDDVGESDRSKYGHSGFWSTGK